MEHVEIGGNSRIVRFLTKDRLKLNGLLFRNERQARTCVIFIHGMTGSLFSNVSLALAGHMGKGLDLFAINTRGYSMVSGFSRFTKGGRRRLIGGTSYEKFEDCIYDIDGAIRAMRALGYRNIVLCGHSTGCQKVIHYQYKTEDRNVKAIVLVGALDDYALDKGRLGRNYSKVLRKCQSLIRRGRGDELVGDESGFTAQRLESVLSLKRPEARILDYDGKMREYGAIKIPILAVFGTKEESAMKPVAQYIRILKDKTSSRLFGSLLINGAMHSFYGKERELAKGISGWLMDD